MKESKFNKYYLLILNALPRKFEEIKPKHFASVATVLFNENWSYHAKLLRILDQLLRPRWKYTRLHLAIFFMDEEQTEELGSLMSFILDTTAASEKSLLPCFYFKGRKYHGPYRLFTNTGWGEFRNAADYCTIYSRTRDIKYLDNAMALYYRRKGEPNDNNHYMDRCERFAKLPLRLKLAFYLNMILALNAIGPEHPNLFCKIPKRSRKPGLWYNFMGEWQQWKLDEIQKVDEQPVRTVLASLEEMLKSNRKKAKDGKVKTK